MLSKQLYNKKKPNISVESREEFAAVRMGRMLPWIVFGLGFTLTTAIGALIIGLSNADRWGFDVMRHEIMGLKTGNLTDAVFRGADYWSILAICSLIPFIGVLYVYLSPVSPVANLEQKPSLGPQIRLARIVYFLCITWLLARVATQIPSFFQSILGAWVSGEISEHYRVRYLVASKLSAQEFGLAYSGLLTLLALPLYKALYIKRGLRAWFEFSLWLAAYWLLALVLVQKLLISYSLFLIGVGLLLATGVFVKLKRFTLLAGVFLGVIHSAMSAFIDNWTPLSTLDHVIGRSADAYPYAIMIAGKHEFGIGQYLAGSVLGGPAFLGESISPNIEVYDLMYPGGDGAMAIAAPVWSYIDVGMLGAILTMLIVCGICWCVSKIAIKFLRNPFGWVIYVFLCLQIYHLTQVPIVGVLFWSYGAIYGLLSLAFVFVLAGNRNKSHSARRFGPIA